MRVKTHHKDGRIMVVVCDDRLVGKKYTEGNKELDLTSEYYQGESMNEQEIGDLLRNADSVTLVGEESIALGINEEVISTENVITIKGVPYAQALLIRD